MSTVAENKFDTDTDGPVQNQHFQNTDINLKYRQESNTFFKRVEQPDDNNDVIVSPTDLGVKCTESPTPKMSESSEPASCELSPSKKRVSAKKFFKNTRVLVLAVCLSCVISNAQGATIPTKQTLPKDCQAWLKREVDCPYRRHEVFGSQWEELNKNCCYAYNNTVSHCQMGYDENDMQYSILACLPDQPGQPGKIPVLKVNKTGYPEIENKPCRDNYYSNRKNNSSFFRDAYCTDRKECPPWQQKACLEGPEKNDRCTCQQGYMAYPDTLKCNSVRGFTTQDGCSCTPLDQECQSSPPPTSDPPRPPNCSDLPSDQKKNWCPQDLDHTSPTSSAGGENTTKPSSTATTPPGNTASKASDCCSVEIIVLIVVCVIVLPLLVVICKKYRRRQTYVVYNSPASNGGKESEKLTEVLITNITPTQR